MATPRTLPEEETVAMAELLVDHIIARFDAVDGEITGSNWYVTFLDRVIAVWFKRTDNTGVVTRTMIDAVLFPSCVKQEMIPVPFPTPVINPVDDTVAILAIADDHITVLCVALDGVMVAIA